MISFTWFPHSSPIMVFSRGTVPSLRRRTTRSSCIGITLEIPNKGCGNTSYWAQLVMIQAFGRLVSSVQLRMILKLTSLWHTGNGWAAAGSLRVLATMRNSEYANTFKNEQNDLAAWVREIHAGIYPHLVSASLTSAIIINASF